MLFDDLIRVHVVTTPEDAWSSIRPGDTLVYDEGASWYVDGVAVSEPSQITFTLRCVVPPEGEAMQFGHAAYMSMGSNDRLPRGITIFKSPCIAKEADLGSAYYNLMEKPQWKS